MAVAIAVQPPQVALNTGAPQGVNPIQQVQVDVATYLADPKGEPRAKRLLELQQTIVDSQQVLIANIQANMQNALQEHVAPLAERVVQLQKTQKINMSAIFAFGAVVGGAVVHFGGKLFQRC